MNTAHPILKYAIGLVAQEYRISPESPDWIDKVALELSRGLQSFRVKPYEDFKGKDYVKFAFANEQKGDTQKGVFLAPNILTPDKTAGNIYKALVELNKKVKSEATKNIDITMSIVPTAGEYLSFGEKKTGRGKPKATNLEAALYLITATTPYKPSMAYKRHSKKGVERTNVAIIPDLDIEELKEFIQLFKRMLATKNEDLLKGKIYREEDKKGNLKIEKPQRPKIHDGNFPNAPSSSALGSVGLLGSIGEWAKEFGEIALANRVLESLKNATMYLISYGNAQTFAYNHYIIELAQRNRLKTIIDSFYYVQLFGKKRWENKEEYEKFDLFTGRFLLLFNGASFSDFLSFRGEYPNSLTELFNTYFIKMANISPEVVASARALGKWLNYVAFTAAKQEVKEEKATSEYWENIKKIKSKVLIELESSTFSARDGDSLIAQAITRAGRLTGMDAPEEAALFMEKTCTGELKLESAKNLLIAFSRLMNKFEKKEKPIMEEVYESEEESSEEDKLNASE